MVLSRDVITQRYHVMNTNVPENPGIWWSVICGQKIHRYFFQKIFSWIVLDGKKMLFEFFKKNLCGFFVHKWRSNIFPVCGFFVHYSQIGVKSSTCVNQNRFEFLPRFREKKEMNFCIKLENYRWRYSCQFQWLSVTLSWVT